jgi:hypothetical protein
MSTCDSFFDLTRHFNTNSDVPGEKLADPKHDLVTFLAVAQKLHVPILPITWQSAREPVGHGGTAVINEALVNIQTNLAFKRVKDRDKENPSKAFQVLISEMSALAHPSIRSHPNIVELQGICWDIPSDVEVWPALVFEKSHFGDLHSFAKLPEWRDLGINERLKLCIDIGTAIRDMHFNSE